MKKKFTTIVELDLETGTITIKNTKTMLSWMDRTKFRFGRFIWGLAV